MTMYEIRNIKVSGKLKSLVLNNALEKLRSLSIPTKIYGNFISFKAQNYTYILFKKGKKDYNHINITQIANFSSIAQAIDILESILDCCVSDYIIDNIIATSDLHRKISLEKIITNGHFTNIKYNNEVFPGLFIKFLMGTVILFHTGKLVIVGCKNQSSLEWILQNIILNI